MDPVPPVLAGVAGRRVGRWGIADSPRSTATRGHPEGTSVYNPSPFSFIFHWGFPSWIHDRLCDITCHTIEIQSATCQQRWMGFWLQTYSIESGASSHQPPPIPPSRVPPTLPYPHSSLQAAKALDPRGCSLDLHQLIQSVMTRAPPGLQRAHPP